MIVGQRRWDLLFAFGVAMVFEGKVCSSMCTNSSFWTIFVESSH